jgi:hypothetical protein
MRIFRRGDRLAHVLRLRRMPVREHVTMIVRHHRVLDDPGTDLFAADHDRNLDPLRRHLRELRLQLRTLGGARKIAFVRVVHRRRYARNPCEAGHEAILCHGGSGHQ